MTSTPPPLSEAPRLAGKWSRPDFWLQATHASDLLPGLAAVALALIIGAILISIKGVSPVRAYAALLDGAMGNRNSIGETLVKTIPLIMAGVGVAVSFRTGVFNVGAEGQLYLGAIAATWVGLSLRSLPSFLILPLMIAASVVVGGLWAAIAAMLKVWLNASEVINTIMMNYIAVFFVGYLVHGPLQEPGSPLGQTARLPAAAQLPVLLSGTRLHVGILLALLVAALGHILLWHTTWGFRLRVTGRNEAAARNAGIHAHWAFISALVFSGALAGLAGFSEAAGVQHRMIENLSPGYGYTAIVVALLGQTTPLGVIAAALLFSALQVGASTMESAVGVPSSVITIIQYLVVLFIIGREAFDRLGGRLRRSASTEL